MNKKQKNLLIWIGVAVVIIVLGAAIWYQNNRPGELDDFARCLDEKGLTFYGAFWCPHCQNQKKLFGNSERLLPYVECSTADGQGTLAVCQNANITSYPTWEFPDGSRQTGVSSLSQLADASGCTLP